MSKDNIKYLTRYQKKHLNLDNNCILKGLSDSESSDSDSSESLGTPSPSPREEVNRISPLFVGVGLVVALCSFLGPKG